MECSNALIYVKRLEYQWTYFEASLLLDWSYYKCLILLENCDWVRWLL